MKNNVYRSYKLCGMGSWQVLKQQPRYSSTLALAINRLILNIACGLFFWYLSATQNAA